MNPDLQALMFPLAHAELAADDARIEREAVASEADERMVATVRPNGKREEL